MPARTGLGLVTVAALSLCVFERVADAGCKVTIKARYTTKVASSDGMKIQLVLSRTEVRTKGGFWATPFSVPYTPGIWLAVGEDGTRDGELMLACSAKRQYRFYVELSKKVEGGWSSVKTAWKYLPGGADDWTEATTIDVGDLGKLF